MRLSPSRGYPAFFDATAAAVGLPRTTRVAGSSSPFGTIHQQRHTGQRAKSPRDEYRMSCKSITVEPPHSGHSLRAEVMTPRSPCSFGLLTRDGQLTAYPLRSQSDSDVRSIDSHARFRFLFLGRGDETRRFGRIVLIEAPDLATEIAAEVVDESNLGGMFEEASAALAAGTRTSRHTRPSLAIKCHLCLSRSDKAGLLA